MLYAGCGACRRVIPLFCGGQFFPHMPMGAIPTPFGVGCPMCGITPPVFTCLTCFTTQHLYMQGAPVQVHALQAQGMHVAPVVHAPQGTGEGMLQGMMRDAVKSFAGSFGDSLASKLCGAFFGG